MYGEDEIWDEFRWEEFMKEQDKKVDRYMELFYRFRHNPDRDQIIAREMGWTWLLDENLSDDHTLRFTDKEDDDDEGEDWKSSAGLQSDDSFDLNAFKNLPVYQRAKDFSRRAFRMVDQLPEAARRDSSVVDFVANAMIASAKIAGGTGMGEDREELGANIAYCKRALGACNLAIASLHEMQERKFLADTTYIDLMKEAIEVRDTIAIHIVDLREKFRRGV